jgi:hypothetical protein
MKTTHAWLIALGLALGLGYQPVDVADPTVFAARFEARLTTETGVSVSTADRTAQATLYLTPHDGDQIALYDGSAWVYYTVADESLDISSCTSGKPYDVFAVDSTGVTLEDLVWTDDTNRATAIVLTTGGVYTKSGDATRRYVGSYYCNAAGETEDSENVRYVFNQYNRRPRALKKLPSASYWSTAVAGTRQTGADTANRVQIMVGTDDVQVRLTYKAMFTNTNNNYDGAGIGLDSTTLYAGDSIYARMVKNGGYWRYGAQYDGTTAVGQHDLNMLEYFAGAGTMYQYCTDGAAQQCGMIGWIRN